MTFEFATASRILFGRGKLAEVGSIARGLGKRALIITGRSQARAQPLIAHLNSAQVESQLASLAGEPSVDDVRRLSTLAREQACDLVIGFGGGSSLDAAKAVAALLTNSGDLFDYLEVVGAGRPLTRPSAPCLAIPTTAGTGAEVTRNSVLAAPEERFKVSLRSPYLLPTVALIDPILTLDLPPHWTAWTGLDALTQLIEPFVSPRANPMTDGFCREGLTRIARSLRQAYACPQDPASREDLAMASLLSGLALANAGLGAVHGFAAPLGGSYSAPHGAVCAALLPHVMRVNLRALESREPGSQARFRYDEIARLLTGRSDATAADGVQWVQELSAALEIQSLKTLGVLADDFSVLKDKAARASSMKANPIVLTPDELQEILELAF